MIKKFLMRSAALIIILAIIASLGVFAVNLHVVHSTSNLLKYSFQDSDLELSTNVLDELKSYDADCALVLGCGIINSETPTDMLKDRLDAGIALYEAGVVPKILLSGDNGTVEHNEIHVMLKYVKDAGIPEEDIFCDHAGFSTYESMYRAKSIFQCSKAIVVTQKYHEYRALYIGKELDIDVIGVSSDQRNYMGQGYRNVRELLARVKDVFKSKSKADPTYGGEEIPITGDGRVSHGE